MSTILCNYCGTLNSLSNTICRSCGLALCDEIFDDDDVYVSYENYSGNQNSTSAITSSVYGIEIDGHDFEAAKNSLKQILNCTKTKPQLTQVKTSGGLFDLFSHNVTGEELNNLTAQIEDLLIQLNSFDINALNQVGKIYDIIERLDKDYIQKIVRTLERAEKASQEAKEAGVDAQKALKDTTKTVNDLAATQKTLQTAQNNLHDANKRIDATVAKLEKTILALSKFKSEIDKIQHLKDIDKLWIDYQSSKKTISDINQRIQGITEKLERYSRTIETLLQWKNTLENLEHLLAIDDLWNDCVELKQEILSWQQSCDEMTETLHAQEHSIQALTVYTNELKQYEHLNDIDDIWNNTAKTKEQLKQTELTISNQQTQIDELKAALSQAQSVNNQKMSISKKLTIAYALSGASLCIALVELVLLFLR